MKSAKNIGLVILIIVVLFISLFTGYTLVRQNAKIQNNILKPYESNIPNEENSKVEIIATEKPYLEEIEPTTKMVYNYVYNDGQTDTNTENAPYYMVGLNETEFISKYSDWDITKFSKEEIVMTKHLDEKGNEYYVVGVNNGFIAVYYQESINGTSLKEITNTPISSLALDEQTRLKNGIIVNTEEELHKVLEDYGS